MNIMVSDPASAANPSKWLRHPFSGNVNVIEKVEVSYNRKGIFPPQYVRGDARYTWTSVVVFKKRKRKTCPGPFSKSRAHGASEWLNRG